MAKHLLVENELKKLNNFDAAYFRDKKCFGDDGIQIYLVFQPINRCFKKMVKLKLFHQGNLKDIDESIFVKFDGSGLIKQGGLASNKTMVNIYIFYNLD